MGELNSKPNLCLAKLSLAQLSPSLFSSNLYFSIRYDRACIYYGSVLAKLNTDKVSKHVLSKTNLRDGSRGNKRQKEPLILVWGVIKHEWK